MLDRRFLSLLGNPRTIGLAAFLLCTPIGVLSALTVVNDPFASVAEVVTLLSIGVLGQLAMGAALLVGHLARPSTRAATMAVALCASVARAVVIALLPPAWGVEAVTTTGERLLAAAIIFLMWLLIFGAAQGANDRYRAEVAALVDEVATHELQLRMMDERQVALQRDRASRRINESTAPIARALDGADGADHVLTAHLVQDAIEERLRPLSHEFWFERRPVLTPPGRSGDFLRRVLGTPVPWTRALPLLTLLATGASLVRWGWPAGLAGLASSALAATIVITCTRLGRARRLPWNLVMYLLLAIVPSSVQVALIEAATGLGQPMFVRAFFAIGVPLALLIGAAANTLIIDREATLRDLRERVAESTWDEHLGELHRRQVETDTASFLHNTVQSRLAAAALQLTLAAEQGDQQRASDALQQAREALDLVSAPADATRSPRERLEQVAAAWEGIAEVTIDMPDGLGNGPGWRTAVEAVQECVANAVRHGRASEVAVRCQQVGSDIELTIEDDGSWPVGGGGAGLGDSWLDRVTKGRWSRTTSGTGTRLALRIPG